MTENEIQELLNSFIWIEPLNNDNFFKVKETLTRIGILSKKVNDTKPTLWQSAHVLQKKGEYAIVHFKQLFLLDGRTHLTNFTQEDRNRVIRIAQLLEKWGLIKIKTPLVQAEPTNVVVIPYSDKSLWDLRTKYTLGKKY